MREIEIEFPNCGVVREIDVIRPFFSVKLLYAKKKEEKKRKKKSYSKLVNLSNLFFISKIHEKHYVFRYTHIL